MRLNLKDYKISNTIMTLRTERWNYIVALLAVACLILLASLNIIFNLVDVAKQVVVSQKEITSISTLHNSIKGEGEKLKKTNELELFGQAPMGIEAATNSTFTLLGIQYTEANPALAKAIINTGTEDGIFKVGDKLANNVSIDSISADSVIIIQNGVKQKLTMNWEDQSLISHKKFERVNFAKTPEDIT